MASVTFNQVTKRFGEVIAVKRLSLDIHDKEFMTFVGPSGCGKSTTLNLLAGLEEADDGEIYIGERMVNDVPPGDRNIAMVFQSYALYPHMKVYDNMAFGLRIQKTPESEVQNRVLEAAQLLEIRDLLDRKPAQLSGGQRQRVALGRAIVRNPDVFLLDEPLSNLDAILRVQMRADLRLLFNRLGSTVVYVTHDQAEAMTMSDRLAVFSAGEIQQVGTPLEVYETPVNMFVARFIGSPPINFVRGQLERTGEQATFLASGISIKLSMTPGLQNWPTEIIAGIRPEDLSILPVSAGIPATVELLEHLGSESIMYANIGDQRLTIKSQKELVARPGENVSLGVTPPSIHFFDPITERRLETR